MEMIKILFEATYMVNDGGKEGWEYRKGHQGSESTNNFNSMERTSEKNGIEIGEERGDENIAVVDRMGSKEFLENFESC